MKTQNAQKHTGGPWKVLCQEQYGESQQTAYIVTVNDEYPVAVTTGRNIYGVLANANLLAAAPEMLDALRALLCNAKEMQKYIDTMTGRERFADDGNQIADYSPEMAQAARVISRATQRLTL